MRLYNISLNNLRRRVGKMLFLVMGLVIGIATIVGIIGGLVGFLSGNGIAWAVLPFVIKQGAFAGIDMSLGLVSILLAISLSLLASLYPAVRASHLDPSEALRVL